MSIEPQAPLRPLIWPPFVRRLAGAVEQPERVYLVGGAVRDALRGRESHDFDLATPDSGRAVARRIADRLKGKYYALDAERDIGRALLPVGDHQTVVDVASFRGESLLDDLLGRDFTINAMAVRLDDLSALLDPLGGQQDLFSRKVLRPCAETSLAADPVRAIRAVRCSLQFGLRMEPGLVESIRGARGGLFDDLGRPLQPERIRDELFKLLGVSRPADALRILDRVGLLAPLGLLPEGDAEMVAERMAVVETLSGLLGAIGPARTDDSAADLVLGTAVMILDRFRSALQTHLATVFADERRLDRLLYLAAASAPSSVDWRAWAATYSLSNAERNLLVILEIARQTIPGELEAADPRAIYRYYKRPAEAGVDGVLLMLAEYLATHLPTPNPVEWGNLLERAAAPLFDAYFNHRAELISPAPLLSGEDLQTYLNLTPGPQIGRILDALLEAQVAGEVGTQKEALQFVKRFLSWL